MRVLVTGGAGFIGSHIVAALTAGGHEVVVLDALLPTAHASPPEQPPGTEWIHGDVRDPDTVVAALRGVDLVCHQAAMVGLGKDFSDAADYVGCNDLATAVLLSAMADTDVRALVLAGSMVVYGEGRYTCPRHGDVRPRPRRGIELSEGKFEPSCPQCGSELAGGLVDESAALDPRNVYAATKVAQEHLSAAWAHATDGMVATLRYHNVYGPGMPRDTPYAGVASFFRSALANGEAPRVFEDGRQRRDFVHVRDVADANVAAAAALESAAPSFYRPFNVASGEPHTIGDMATALATAHGGPMPRVTGEYRLGDVRHITASTARIGSELNWKPQIGFAAGMREFADAPLRSSRPAPDK